MDLKEELEEIIKRMKEIKGTVGCIIAKRDGLLVVSYMPPRVDSKLLAALAAAIVKSSTISSREMGLGRVENTIVKSSEGYYVCFPIDEELILASLLEKDANLGIVLIKMEQALKSIVKILI